MNIDIKDAITLSDNNKYVVCGKTSYETKKYYYLVDVNNNENIKFCFENNDELVEVEDPKLIEKLLPMFVDSVKSELKNIVEDNL